MKDLDLHVCYNRFVIGSNFPLVAKGLVAELASPHAQSVWGFRGERIQAAGLTSLTSYCNYLSKKKKKFPYI